MAKKAQILVNHPLSFLCQVLTNVERIAIGLVSKGNMRIPGGSGKMFFDDIHS